MKILHLVKDDKFIDFFYQQCQRLENSEHFFMIYRPIGRRDFKYIKHARPYKVVTEIDFFSPKMKTELAQFDALVIHSLTQIAQLMVLRAPKRMPVLWSGWGNDYYPLFWPGKDWLYEPLTQAVSKQLSNDWLANPHKMRRLLQSVLSPCLQGLRKKALARFDYFSAPIETDYALLNAQLPVVSAQYLQLNYCSVKETFSTSAQGISGQNILVGNSATLSNNHLDVFAALRKLDLSGRKVIVPLSYGDRAYTKVVLAKGKEMLKDRFQPLVDFMPLDQYQNTIASCGIVVMNHIRQQAIGNIGLMLNLGAKVFIHPKSTTYQFFCQNEAVVFSTHSLSDDDALTSLDSAQVQRNKALLEQYWSDQAVQRNLKNMVTTLQQHTRA